MNIYVGNLPATATENEIRGIFEEFGTVHSVKMINDHETGRFRGFAFIDMSQNSAVRAIQELNGAEFEDRVLVVNEAKQKTDRRPGMGGGNFNSHNPRFGNGGGGRPNRY
jgi:RNA recognition motif-containing protein